MEPGTVQVLAKPASTDYLRYGAYLINDQDTQRLRCNLVGIDIHDGGCLFPGRS
jgi:hypothetical protein